MFTDCDDVLLAVELSPLDDLEPLPVSEAEPDSLPYVPPLMPSALPSECPRLSE